jgi:peptide/nickel transport system substrate-binding protein
MTPRRPPDWTSRRRAGRIARRPLLLGLLLAACASPTPEPSPTPAPPPPTPTLAPPTPLPAATPRPPAGRQGGQATEGVLVLPNSLNPLLADDVAGRRLAALLYDGLVRVDDASLGPAPALAERWEVTDDGRALAFRLRAGLTFHDGRPVTAADVVATYQAVAADRGLSARAAALGAVLQSVTAQGDSGVAMTLRQPYAPFLTELATLPVLPASHLAAGSLESSPAGAAPVGAGPFQFAGRSGEQIMVRRFAGYWAGAPPLESIGLRRVADADALLGALIDGALDLVDTDPAWLTAARLERLRAAGSVALLSYQALTLTQVTFQLDAARSAALADGRVRRALAHAVDRPAVAAAATLGLGELPTGTMPPRSWAAVPNIEPTYPYDTTRAGTFLDLAGWPRGGDGRRLRDGQPLAVTLLTNTGNTLRAAVQEHLATAWRALGVTVTTRLERFDAYVEALQRGDFDAAILGLDLGPDPDQGLLWESHAARGGYNFGRYSNAQVDRLLQTARGLADRAARQRLYEDMQRAVLTDLPALPLASPSGLLAVGPRLRAVAPSPVDPSHGAAGWWVTG